MLGGVSYSVQANTHSFVLPTTFDYEDNYLNGMYFIRLLSIDDDTSYLATGENEQYFLGTNQDVVHSLIYTYTVFAVMSVLFILISKFRRNAKV